MNTWRITGSIRFAGSARSLLSTGTSRQPSSTWPSSLAARSISYSQARRDAGSRGRNTMPTPYWPAGGSFTACFAMISRKNLSGIWIRQPAPSESFGSQPTAPRWVRLRRTVSPCSTIECDFLPLMWATKPTPHASCSFAGWYRPWGSGRKLGFTLGFKNQSCRRPNPSTGRFSTPGSWTIPAFPFCLKCLAVALQSSNPSVVSAHLGGQARKRALDRRSRNVCPERRSAQAFQQDEMDPALSCLLVDAHELPHACRVDPWSGNRKSRALQKRPDAACVGLRKKPELTRQVRGHGHSGSDRLAVQPGAIAQARLDGMAEGVAEIKQLAQASLAFVLADDFGLDRNRAHHRVAECIGIAREQAIEIGFEPAEERRVADQAILDHLGDSGAQLALGQGLQGIEVGEHQLGLMKSADHVFPERMVDRGLAADRRIHLREERRGNLDVLHAALIGGGGKAGQVPDHSAPESDESTVAPAALLEQRIEDRVERAPVLVFLPIGDHDADHLDPPAGEGAGEALHEKRRNRRIGHDGHFLLREARQNEIGSVEQPRADVDGVGALAERYAESLHASPNFASTCASNEPTLWRPVSITRSATSRYRGSRSA